MKINEKSAVVQAVPAETELDLQEELARRQRAAELFGEPDWEDEPELDEDEDEDEG